MAVFHTNETHTFESLDKIATELCSINTDLRWYERESSFRGWYNLVEMKGQKDEILLIMLNDGGDMGLEYDDLPEKSAIIEFISNDLSKPGYKMLYDYLLLNSNSFSLKDDNVMDQDTSPPKTTRTFRETNSSN